jgi:hypothetical protein
MIYSDDGPGPELLQVLSGPEESDPDKRKDRIGSLQSHQGSNGAEALDGKILHDTKPRTQETAPAKMPVPPPAKLYRFGAKYTHKKPHRLHKQP